MDQVKTGRLIRQLRSEKNMTQKQLAELLNVSDKTVSKWECGNGCPDISSLRELAQALETDVRVLLSGEIGKNESEKGNMKKLKFYVCRDCGNIITSTSEASISCCGGILSELVPRKAEENEMLKVEKLDTELYITSNHPMTKEHYISFVAYICDRSAVIFKQYPEWKLEINLPLYRMGRLVWYCTKCGLMYQDI